MAPSSILALADLGRLDPYEQEYADAKVGQLPEDQIADDIRQFREMNASNVQEAQLESDGESPTPAPPIADHRPSLDEFLQETTPLNPHASQNDLIAFWSKNLAPHVAPSALPTFEDFAKEAAPLNPDATPEELKHYWQAAFGERGAREKARTVGDYVTNAAHEFVRGIAEIPADALKSIGKASEELDRYMPEAIRDPRKAEDRATYKLGETIQQLSERLFPTDPELRQSFILSVLPNTFGQVAGFIAGGEALSLAKAPGVTAALLGAGVQGAQQYEEAKQYGATDKAERISFGLGSALGLTEALPLELVFNGIPGLRLGGRLWQAAVSGGVVGTAELLQEVGQQIGSNKVAQVFYDKNRSLFEGAGISAGAGGVTGLVTGFLSGLLSRRASRHGGPPGGEVTPPSPPTAGTVPSTPGGPAGPSPGPAPTVPPGIVPPVPQGQTSLEEILAPEKTIEGSIRAMELYADQEPSETVKGLSLRTLTEAEVPPVPSVPSPPTPTSGSLGLQPGTFVSGAETTALPETPPTTTVAPPTTTEQLPPQVVQPTTITPLQQEMQRARGQAVQPAVQPEPTPQASVTIPPTPPVIEETNRRAEIRQEIERAKGERVTPAQEELQRARGIQPAPAPTTTVEDIHALAEARGIPWDNDKTFMAMSQQATGEAHLDKMTPLQLQRMADVLTPKAQRTPEQTARMQIPLPKAQKVAAAPVAPEQAPVLQQEAVTTPRHELPAAENQDMLLRAEKAQADMESGRGEPSNSLIDFLRSKGGVQDQGGELSTLDAGSKKHLFQKNVIQPTGMTLDEAAQIAHEADYIPRRDTGLLLERMDKEIRGIGQAPDWYVALTEGPKAPFKTDKFQTAQQKIETAIQKIIQDEGKDRGQAVEQVKAAILNDREFAQTPWGREAARLLEGETNAPQQARFNDYLSGLVRKSAQEARGQEILDQMEESNISPRDVAKQFYDHTYGQLPANVRARFDRMIKNVIGLEPGAALDVNTQTGERTIAKDYGHIISEADLPESVEYLEGTERGLVALMKEANDRFPAKEPFALQAETPRVPKPKAPEQLGIPVPPETVGTRPIIGREVAPETAATEAPLFSQAAQTPQAEQTTLPEDEADFAGGRDLSPEEHRALVQQMLQAYPTAPTIGKTTTILADSAETVPQEFLAELARSPYIHRLAMSVRQALQAFQSELDIGQPAVFRGFDLNMAMRGVNVPPRLTGRPRSHARQILMNPFALLAAAIRMGKETGAARAQFVAGHLTDDLIHEITHQQFRGHERDFVQQFKHNRAMLRDAHAQFRAEFIRVLEASHDARSIIDALNYDNLRREAAVRDGLARGGRGAAELGPARLGRDHQRDDSVDLGRGQDRSGGILPARVHGGGGRPPGQQPPVAEPPALGGGGAHEVGTLDPGWARRRLKGAKTSLRPHFLGALGLSQLADVYGQAHPEVAAYNKFTQEMKADFIDLTNQADPLIRRWDKLKVDVADRLSKIMEEAVRLNFDPDGTVAPKTPTAAHNLLRNEFTLLTAHPDALAVYRDVRDFYRTLLNARFQALLARINRAGGTPASKRAALQDVVDAYKPLADKVYFPQTRFGPYVVIAKQMQNGKEIDREVHTFEAPAEADKFAETMKARGGWVVKQTTTQAYNADSESRMSPLVQRLEDVIDRLPGEGDFVGDFSSKKQLKDALRQTFLQSLPDLSYAKHFIHAKNVKGASRDALRAFADAALHGAHHIARMRYADRMGQALNRMDGRIRTVEAGDVTEARQVLNELITRHSTIVNPQISPVAAWLGQLGFTMSLGGVVATGVTNMTQVPLVTLPWLGARYGFAKSSGALAQAYKDFLDPATLNLDSLFDASKSAKLPADERRMLKELQRRGKVDLTQTMDLSGRAAQDNLSRVARQIGTKRELFVRMLGFTFHAPEVMNRQVTALATYRLAKGRGDTYDFALAKAEEAIDRTHFIYTAENRPRYFTGNVLRVLTMFKQYGQNIAYLYGRAAHLWLAENGVTGAERKIARNQLLSMFGLQLAAAGVLGVPFFGTVASLLNALMNGLGDEDEKKDWQTELRKIMADNMGKWPAEVLAHGVTRLTPWDLSARLGQNDLFLRTPKMEREGRAAAMDWATSLAGPVVGYGVNAYLGIEDMVKGLTQADSGHFLRGVEEMVPAVLRHSVKALRYHVEGGVRTRDQYKQLDVSAWEKLGQLFGFTPSRAAEMYEGVTAIKQAEHRVLVRRSELLDAFANAVQDHDAAARERVLADVRAFNARNKELHITGETLHKSLKGRETREAGMKEGVYLPKTRAPLREQGQFANY